MMLTRTSWMLPYILFCFAMLCESRTLAGPVPMPLTARLDMAYTVVIGEVTKIVIENYKELGIRNVESAVIQVTETLKGPRNKTVCCDNGPADTGGSAIRRVHSKGEAGIWIIGGDSLGADCLPMEFLPDVQTALKLLSDRKWSEPVNGLRSWAAAVPDVHDRTHNTHIIYAVQNVTKQSINVPNENTAGFLTATASAENTSHTYALSRFTQIDVPFCQSLAPGAVMYLHPGCTDINLNRDANVPAGDYVVQITCRNDQAKGRLPLSDAAARVDAWTGTLTTPAFEVKVEKW